MDHISTAFIFDGGGSSNVYTGLMLLWDPDDQGLREFQEFNGWAVTRKGAFQCKFSQTGECRHVYGVDSEGKEFSEWETQEIRESELFRGGGVDLPGLFRCDVRISDFPFFLTNMRGSWVYEPALIARLSVERLGDLPEAQRRLRAQARWDTVMGVESKLNFTAKEAISEGMILSVEWAEKRRACVGAVHLRRRLEGRDWLVDYYGVHGFEMDLEGAKLTHTVFDRWDTRKCLWPPGSPQDQRAASIPDQEKHGNVPLSVQYGVIVGKA